MTLSRRTLLRSGAAAAGLTLGGRALGTSRPDLVVYDSTRLASRAFARRHGSEAFDVSAGDQALWRAFRRSAPTGRIVGLTTWNELVRARGLLEERGKRLAYEEKRGPLFLWAMT